MDGLKYKITLEDFEGDSITRTVDWDKSWPELVSIFVQMLRGMGYQIACCAEDVITQNLEEFHTNTLSSGV
jgi:hypothetical protein